MMLRYAKFSTRDDATPPVTPRAQLACDGRNSTYGFRKVPAAPTACARYRKRLPSGLIMKSPLFHYKVELRYYGTAFPYGNSVAASREVTAGKQKIDRSVG